MLSALEVYGWDLVLAYVLCGAAVLGAIHWVSMRHLRQDLHTEYESIRQQVPPSLIAENQIRADLADISRRVEQNTAQLLEIEKRLDELCERVLPRLGANESRS